MNSTADSAVYTRPMVLLTTLFFMWGLITVLNDILIPHLKSVFDLSYFQATLIQLCFFSAYFIVSIPAGRLIARVGYQRGIIVGLLIAAAGCLLFIPASVTNIYALFLSALFVLASGITILQVAANPYVAVLGTPQNASARLNLTQAFNSLGTFLAPLLGSLFILEATTGVVSDASAVQGPYLILAITLIMIAVGIWQAHLPNIEHTTAAHLQTEKKSIFSFPQMRWGSISIFIYVGAEVAIGSLVVNYLGENTIMGLSEKEAGPLLSYYWGGAMIGRFLGSYLLQSIHPGRLLLINGLIASAMVFISVSTGGELAMWAILAVGLFNSVMFANIFTLSIHKLGPYTSEASGILCMAIVGGAVIPNMQGYLADRIGLQLSFILPALCYIYLAVYGWRETATEIHHD